MKVFIDSNVFIYGVLFENSNSKIVLNLAVAKIISSFTSELAIKEVKKFFANNFGEKPAYFAVKYVQNLCIVVPFYEIRNETKKWKGKIKEKDLENLATAKHLKANYLVSYDKDYKNFKEHKTPKQFVKQMGLKHFESEF